MSRLLPDPLNKLSFGVGIISAYWSGAFQYNIGLLSSYQIIQKLLLS